MRMLMPNTIIQVNIEPFGYNTNDNKNIYLSPIVVVACAKIIIKYIAVVQNVPEIISLRWVYPL